MLLIIDSDPIVYRSGFAAESISYDVVVEAPDGSLAQHYFEPKDGKSANDLLKAALIEMPGWEVISKEKIVKAEPVSHALEIVRSSLASISAEVAKHFATELQEQLFVSGSTNFRNKIATLLPYKGNRDPAHKPVHYKAIRDYLVASHAAEITDGIEADDAVAMIAAMERSRPGHCAEDYCVASIDKDLDQIPGWHYDYMKKVFYFIDPEDAAKSFWCQVLSGDSTDNIGGVWKLGPKKAKQLVEQWLSAAPFEYIWEHVVEEYRLSQTKPSCPYVDKAADEVALENARLLYLQKKPDELWNPPGIPRGKVSVEFAG